MSTTPRFAITVDSLGHGDMSIDGQPIPEVDGIDVRIRPGQPTVVTLHHQADLDLTGSGLVQSNVDQDPGELVAEFLDQIDPQLLEQTALMNADASQSLTGTMLAQLAAWARGAT